MQGKFSSSHLFKGCKPCWRASRELQEVGCRVCPGWKQGCWDVGWLRPCHAVQQLYEFQKISVILASPGGIWIRQECDHHLGVLPCVPARFLGKFWGWLEGGGSEAMLSGLCSPWDYKRISQRCWAPSPATLLLAPKVQAAEAGRRSSLRGLNKPSVK